MNDDERHPPEYKYRAQRNRIDFLLEQFEVVLTVLHRADEAANQLIHADTALLNELAESERQDLRNHLARAAEYVRSAERVAYRYWIDLDTMMEREGVPLRGNLTPQADRPDGEFRDGI
jgi:ABC-type transporter Mla subunit MlaD